MFHAQASLLVRVHGEQNDEGMDIGTFVIVAMVGFNLAALIDARINNISRIDYHY